MPEVPRTVGDYKTSKFLWCFTTHAGKRVTLEETARFKLRCPTCGREYSYGHGKLYPIDGGSPGGKKT